MVSFNKWIYTQNLLLISILLFILFGALLFYDIKLALLVKSFVFKTINNHKSPHIVLYLFKNFSLMLAFLACSYLTFLVFSAFNSFFTYYCYLLMSAKSKIRKFKLENIIFKGINWQFQKMGIVFSPVIITMLAVSAFIFVGYFGFNQILFFTGKHFAFGVFVLNLLLFLMLLFLFSTPFISVLLSVLCLYGTEISITEPDITNKNIFLRSEKLFWKSKYNIFLAILSSVFVFILFEQFYFFVFEMEKVDLETFLAYLVYNMTFFCVLKFLKSRFYIKSLISQYKISLRSISAS